MYLQDALSNRDYLVDTRASRSVFSHRSSAAPTGPRLLMADGRPTKAWGSRLIPLQFGSRRFQFQFLLADVDQPILGADFLAEVDLLVDTKNRQVLHRLGFLPPIPPFPLCVNSPLMLPLSWMSFPQPGIHKHLVNPLNTTLSMLLRQKDNRYMLSPTVWIKLSQLKLRLSFKNCNWRGLSVGLIVLGSHLYIWFQNLMGPGILAGITAV